MEDKAKQILESAIQMEKDGIEFYTKAAMNVQNPMGKEMFESLVQDEKRHIEKINAAINGMGIGGVGTDNARELHGRIKTIFSEADVPSDAHSEEIDTIRTAIRMEEEGIRFYTEKCLSLGGKAAELCSFIITEEKNHRNILNNTLLYLEDNKDWNVETEGWSFEG
ncbi:MAG: ferritin family protein [Elusimicrobia bacterium]|nr:ferritin family protein [Elusimicrobiota bacterium]